MIPRLALVWTLLLLEIYIIACAPDEEIQAGAEGGGLAVTNFTADSVTLSWGRPVGAAELCWLQLPPGEAAPACERPPPDHTSHTLKLEDACETHRFTLTPDKGPALTLEFSADKDGTGPGGPRGFKGLRYPGGMVVFEWSPPLPPGNYCIAHYQLAVVGGDVIADDAPPSTNKHEARGLPVCAGLNVSLTASTAGGRQSQPAYFQLQPQEAAPGAVKELEVTDSRTHGLYLRWKKPEKVDCLKEYSVCWRLTGQTNETCETSPRTEKDFSTFEMTRLRPCQMYAIRVISVGARDLRGISPVILRETGPEFISNLKVDQIDIHQATVSWDAPSCAESYSVCWANWTGRAKPHCIRTSATSATVTDLHGVDRGDNYTVTVVAISSYGGHSNSRNITLQMPGPVQDLKLLNHNSDSATVSWTAPEMPEVTVSHVQLCWATLGGGVDDSDAGNCVPVPLPLTTFTIVGLSACSWYQVNISNVHASGARSQARNITLLTAEDGSATSGGGFEKFSVVKEKTSSPKMKASWDLQEGCTPHVKVCWGPVDGEESACSEVPSYQSSIIIGDLKFCTNYSVTGKALAPNGTELDSNTDYHFSGAGRPRNVTAVAVAPATFKVTWLPPPQEQDCVVHYKIDFDELLPPNTTEHIVHAPGPCVYHMTGLSVVSDGGTDSHLVPVYFSSGIAAPGKVNDLTGHSAESTSISLEWKEPSENLQCVKKYSVCWRRANETHEHCDTAVFGSYPKYTVRGLEPCAEYTAKVAAVGGNETGENTTVDVYTGPERVSDLEAQQVDPQRVLLYWSGISCASLYSVCWGSWEGKGAHLCVNVSDTQAQISDLTDLDKGEKYTVIVKAIGRTGSISRSRIVVLENSCPVKDLKVTNHTKKSISASWDLPGYCRKRASHFEVCWDVITYGVLDCSHVPPESLNFNLLNLQQCKWYNITVTAVYVDGVKSETRSVLQYISDETKKNPAPPSLATPRYRKDGQIVLKLKTTDEEDSCVEYTAVCWTSSRDPTGETCELVPSYEKYLVVHDAKFCAVYNFSAAALTPDHRRSEEEHTSLQLGPGPPRNVWARSPSPGTVLVTWDPPSPGDDCVDHYTVVDGIWGETVGKNISADNREYLIADLPLCTFVMLAVVAHSPDDDKSEVVLARTSAGMRAPGDIRNLTAVYVGSHSVHLQWSTPSEYYRCLKKYSVCRKEKSEPNETCSIQKVVEYPQHTISGLKSSTEYFINVSSQGEKLHGNASQLVVVTGPEAVQGLKARQVDPQTVFLEWNETSSTSVYSVCWGAWDGLGARSCVNVSESKARISDLRDLGSGGKYTVIVKAIGQTGGSSSPAIVVLEKTCPVSDLTSTNHTAESVFLSWDIPEDCQERVEGFEVCWKDLPYGSQNCSRSSSNASTFDLQQLLPCKWYNITISAVYMDGVTSELRSTLQFTSVESERDPVPLEHLSAFYVNGGRMELTFRLIEDEDILCDEHNDICGNKLDACVEYANFCWTSSKDPTTELCEKVASYRENHMIDNAKFCSTYNVSGTALTRDGRRSEEKTTSLSIGPGLARNVSAKSPSPGKLLVTWEPPLPAEDCVDHYAIVNGMWGFAPVEDIPADSREYLLTDEELCSFSYHEVVAYSADGSSSEGSKVYASTGMAAPGEISNLTAVYVESHSIHLQWSTPSEYFSCLKKYSVCWRENSESNVTCSIQKVVKYPHHSISGLKSCTEYSINVTSQGEVISGNASNILVTTGPEPVGELKADVGSESVTLKWQPSACTNYYSLCWGGWGKRGEHRCTFSWDTEYTLASWEYDQWADSHTFIARAVGDAGGSSSPSVLTLPKRLLRLTVAEVQHAEVTLSWRYSPEDRQALDHLELCVTLNGTDYWDCKIVNATEDDGNVTLSGLQPCSGYRLRGVAVDADGKDLDTATDEFFTRQEGEGSGEDDKVVGLKVTNTSSSTLTLQWDGLANMTCVRKYVLSGFTDVGMISDKLLSNSTHSYVLTDIPPCSLVMVSMTALLPDGSASEPATMKTDSGIQAPGEAEDLEVFHTTSSSIHIKWSPPSEKNVCLVRFLVCWRAEDSEAQNCSEQIQTSYNAFSILGLRPCTTYDVSVTGLGSEKDFGNATFILSSTGSEPVRSLTAEQHGPHEVTLNWEAPVCAKAYSVCWGGWTNLGAHSCDETNSTSYTVSELEEGESYTFTVEARTEEGQLSDPQVVVWTEMSPFDIFVLDFEITDVTPHAVHFKWGGIDQNIAFDHYVVEVVSFGDVVVTSNISSNERTFVAEDLPPCTLLTYQIYAILPDGRATGASKIISDTGTEAPGDIEGLEVFHTSSRSIHLQWTPPEEKTDCLMKYLICWKAQNSTTEKCSDVTQTIYNVFSITGLEPCNTYAISVAAMGSDKDVGNATRITWSTGPEPVRALTASGHLPHEVTLNWEAPACAKAYSVCWGGWTGRGVHSCGQSTNTSLTVHGLQEARSYTVIVAAEISRGQISDKAVLVWNNTAIPSSILS